jgi:hypothetical protein
VVDQGTGNPIPGALVIGSWAFETPAGLSTPEASHTKSTQTGSDGGYRLPSLPTGQYRPALLRRFSLIVYKAGYLGYRSDYRSDDRSPRHDFAQRNNRIRLDRFAQGESHAKHLVFLGASPELRDVAQTEIVQAALELAESSPPPPRLAALEAPLPTPAAAPPKEPATLTLPMRLLTRADVEELATQAGTPHTYGLAPLPELTAVSGFEAVHYKAQDSPETWDAALRIWRTASGAAAKAAFQRLRAKVGTPPLRDGSAAAPTLSPPARAASPLLPPVPAVATPLRDAAGNEHPPSPPPLLTAGSTGTPAPLSIDDTLRVYDAKLGIYGIVVLSRPLGVVLQLTCGAKLCKNEDDAAQLMTRVLGRL